MERRKLSSVTATVMNSTTTISPNSPKRKPVGINPDTNLVEVVELENHPWFIGVQYHPEYKSTVQNPHPLFVSFIKAATDYCQTHNSK